MGKAPVSNITVSLALVVVPKAPAMAGLSVVPGPLGIVPPPTSRFRPLAACCPISWHLAGKHPPPSWHHTAPHRLGHYCYTLAGTLLLHLRSVDLSSVMPSRSIALPPWLLSNAWDRCNDLHDCASGYCGPMVSMFSAVADHQSSNPGPKGP